MNKLEQDLNEAAAFHGHLCVGQIMGVRMAQLALNILGIKNPGKYKNLVVYVEADRCLADAILVTTKCTMGKRRLKWVDYGKMAATFVDLAQNKAIRIGPRNLSLKPQEGEDPIAFWKKIPDEQLFNIQNVRVDIPPGDLPGSAIKTVVCEECGEKVHDGRQIVKDHKVYCRACANGAYYRLT